MTIQSDILRSSRRPALERSVAYTQPFLRSFIGSSILLLSATLGERLFFGTGYFSSLDLHPFWIIVVLAALHDGVFVGVAVAGMATLMMDWPPRPMGMDITAHYIGLAILPLQWLMAALFIGLFRSAEIKRERRLEADKAELTYMNETFADEIRHLDEEIGKAQLRAVTRARVDTQSHFMIETLLTLHAAPASEVARVFREAARMFSTHPAGLFFVPEMMASAGLFEGQGDSLSDLSLPPEAVKALIAELRTAPVPIVITSDRVESGYSAKYFIVAGIRTQPSRKAIGAVVFQANTMSEADSLSKVAEFFATIISNTVARGKESAPRRLIKSSRYRLQNRIAAGNKNA